MLERDTFSSTEHKGNEGEAIGSKRDPISVRPISPHIYDRKYFLSDCEGYTEFTESFGAKLSPRLQEALRIAEIGPEMKVLDVGFGRGEIVLQCAMKGAQAYGIDYAEGAVDIARATILKNQGGSFPLEAYIVQADAKNIPFANDSFDRVLMFDLVEHLHEWELAIALREVKRILKHDGRLIIHTAPNRWRYIFVYPLFRIFERLRGKNLPSDPRARYPYHKEMHVNEQDILRLKSTLRKAGFSSRVWLRDITGIHRYSGKAFIQVCAYIALNLYPFRWVFRNDIFAVAQRRTPV